VVPDPQEPFAGIFVQDWLRAVEGEVESTVLVRGETSLPRALAFLLRRGPLNERVVVPVRLFNALCGMTAVVLRRRQIVVIARRGLVGD
jgi:hypothetical protein